MRAVNALVASCELVLGRTIRSSQCLGCSLRDTVMKALLCAFYVLPFVGGLLSDMSVEELLPLISALYKRRSEIHSILCRNENTLGFLVKVRQGQGYAAGDLSHTQEFERALRALLRANT